MRNSALLFLTVALTGCAASSSGLLNQQSPELAVSSRKSAQDFALCTAESLKGPAQLRGSGGHWWVLRSNGFEHVVVRWDFTDQASGGSIAELRSSTWAGAAKDKVQACAA